MLVGTQGFQGARLVEAREARGMSAATLSEILPVTRAAVSQYEHDQRTPSPEVMQMICERLNFPLAFFCRPLGDKMIAPVFYRSLASATKTARQRADRRLDWLHDVTEYVRNYVDLPAPNLPALDLPSAPELIDDRDIERAASDVRRFWGLGDGPISNALWLAENNGVVVARTSLGSTKMDALSALDERDQTPYLLLNADKGTAVRWRFDVGHELGHLMLHRHLSRSIVCRLENHTLIEKQAHRFGAALLLPARSLIDDYYAASLDALLRLKEKWRVAISMLIVRCRELGLMTEETALRLRIARARRGWTQREPLDDSLPAEQPALIRRSMEMLVQDGTCGREEIAAALPYAVNDVAELSNVSPAFLGASYGEVRTLEPAVTPRVPSGGTRGSVVNFRPKRAR